MIKLPVDLNSVSISEGNLQYMLSDSCGIILIYQTEIELIYYVSIIKQRKCLPVKRALLGFHVFVVGGEDSWKILT